jgi:hypothetical protein
MKELKFLCAQPDDDYYLWQVHLWIESLKNIGHSDKAIVLVFTPSHRIENKKWKMLVDLYPETEFVFYKDVDGVTKLIPVYIPVLRPYCLMKYFKENPTMVNKAVFYCDSDILFMEDFKLDEFLNDDVNYLSNTNGYINASYFDSKIKDVLPEKLEEYKTRDILSEITSVIGINREIAEKNNLHSGGAQYLLKNVGASFWEKVIGDCITIRKYLLHINGYFFENESKGFQSWCADMWAVLWNLWLREQETKVVKELDFAWSTDPISRLSTTTILHNAGITGDDTNGYPAFYKGKYHTGINPFLDPHMETVLNSEESKKYCTHHYVTKMMELKKKYNLTY